MAARSAPASRRARWPQKIPVHPHKCELRTGAWAGRRVSLVHVCYDSVAERDASAAEASPAGQRRGARFGLGAARGVCILHGARATR